MNSNILPMLGLCKRAGMLEIGEEPVEAVARAKVARVLLLACDAADNTVRRTRHFAEAGSCIWLFVPYTKEELGRALGRTSCAILAVTDIGFAAAIVRRLAEMDPIRYGEAAQRLDLKARRAAERRAEMLAHEKNLRTGRVRKKAPPPPPEEPALLRKAPPAPRGVPRPPHRADGAPHRPGEGPRPHQGGSFSHGGSRSGHDRDRKRRSPHPADRFQNSRPVKKGKGSPKKTGGPGF